MNRRDAVLAPLTLGVATLARTQVPGRSYRVGYLGFNAAHAPGEPRDWNTFVERLRELGYSRGRNLVIEERYIKGTRDLHYTDFVVEMLKIKADAVVVGSATAARYVMGLSRTLPIVALFLADPVRSGLVASLAHPGGQLTGLSDLSDELVLKQLELLKAAAPSIKRIAHARCPRCALFGGLPGDKLREQYASLDAAAHTLGVTLVAADLSDTTLFDDTAAMLVRERADALLIGVNVINVALRDRWVTFAAQRRLPTLAAYPGFGALLSYGPDYAVIYRKAAEYVAKILGGAAPGDLPMEQPTRFEFVVNLKTAKALGITIPQSLLLRADEVIQ